LHVVSKSSDSGFDGVKFEAFVKMARTKGYFDKCPEGSEPYHMRLALLKKKFLKAMSNKRFMQRQQQQPQQQQPQQQQQQQQPQAQQPQAQKQQQQQVPGPGPGQTEQVRPALSAEQIELRRYYEAAYVHRRNLLLGEQKEEKTRALEKLAEAQQPRMVLLQQTHAEVSKREKEAGRQRDALAEDAIGEEEEEMWLQQRLQAVKRRKEEVAELKRTFEQEQKDAESALDTRHRAAQLDLQKEVQAELRAKQRNI
jgi:hypothetical protein